MPKKKAKAKKRKSNKVKKKKVKKSKVRKSSLVPATGLEEEEIQEKLEWFEENNEENIFGQEVGEEQEEFDDWGYEEDEELM